jgi:adenylate kinase family enzyme
MRIAILGKMCSGKTTTSNFIIDYLKNNENIIIKKVSFATKVYDIAYDLFDMKIKNRELLQSIGTKMREIDEDIWIKYVLKNNKNNIIIDDLRYPNELEALKRENFIIIKLELDKDTQLKRLKKCYPDTYQNHINNMNHESESLMDTMDNSEFDFILKSDDNILVNLIKCINEIILKKKIKKDDYVDFLSC